MTCPGRMEFGRLKNSGMRDVPKNLPYYHGISLNKIPLRLAGKEEMWGDNPRPCPLCGYSSTGRASALQAEGCRFKSCYPHQKTYRGVAQFGSALGLGPRGCRFKSGLPDHFFVNEDIWKQNDVVYVVKKNH